MCKIRKQPPIIKSFMRFNMQGSSVLSVLDAFQNGPISPVQ